MRFKIFVFLLFLSNLTFAQQGKNVNIKGIVLDSNNQDPLPNTFIYLKNHSEFSILSSSSGEFDLNYPNLFKTDTLVISLLGYQKKQIPLSNLNQKINQISLNQVDISLQEVVVQPDESLFEEFFTKVIENIPNNYPTKKHQFNAFYRRVSTDYNEYTKLVEAAVLIEDYDYKRDIYHSKIKIEALRQSDELGDVDSVLIQSFQRLSEHIAKQVDRMRANSMINMGFESNLIRYARSPNSIFSKEDYKVAFFGSSRFPVYHSLVGTEIRGQDTIFHIAFGNTDPPKGDSFMKINSRNFGIEEFQLIPFTSLAFKHFTQFYMKYKEVEGVYYPEKIEYKTMRFINRDIGSHQVDIHTFWFDDVQTENLQKIRPREVLDRDFVIETRSFDYDKDFWERYELIKKHPLDPSIKKSLERFKSLEKQFEENSKK
ncbi:carboxypeptidase-like regulatory domain-containing protein [Belliella sp. DSM 107340]|uniref:Carboxypeptidase-like regulatory domain-containing protein n=1 Tax=Belliella calami TaxID=2923436 RepID=A0ABS9URK6_9BACT|nr:carboxypeptidase-like regulatory domain-containing protein [Belliella calami]MCH7399261.1 carboxypeptidase-like regulatory domain-containing protein [Belliella calami]